MKLTTLLCLTFLIFSGCSNEVRQEPLLDQDVIVAFGDSLTYGYGTTKANSYPSKLDGWLEQKVINEGVSGEETAYSLKRIDSVLAKHRPSLVLLCIGGNDFLRKRPKTTTTKNIALLIEKIHQSGSRVVLIAVPELGLFLSPSPIYAELAESHQVILVEEILSDLIGNTQLKSDSIHLNAKGYALLAEKILEKLKSSGLVI